jgi:hypothetical protein
MISGPLRYERPAETGQTRPAIGTGHELAADGTRWNHGAADPEIVWILVEICGQLDGCEYRSHPNR